MQHIQPHCRLMVSTLQAWGVRFVSLIQELTIPIPLWGDVMETAVALLDAKSGEDGIIAQTTLDVRPLMKFPRMLKDMALMLLVLLLRTTPSAVLPLMRASSCSRPATLQELVLTMTFNQE